MARGRSRGKATTQRNPVRSSKRRKSTLQDALPEVYQDMLADAVPSSPTKEGEDGRTIKKRRIGGRVVIQGHDFTSDAPDSTASETAGNTDIERNDMPNKTPLQQTAYADSSDSADSDMEWEEVNLKDGVKVEGSPDESGDEVKELDLILDGQGGTVPKSSKARRKPASTFESKLRLDVHKMHLICLFVHAHLRNHWCNDEKVQAALKKLLSAKTISYLNPNETESQFQMSRSFIDGLSQAVAVFKDSFRITARGMCRPYWAENVQVLPELNLPEDIDLPMDKSDFRDTAGRLRASRDIGAQLFCALLRAAGVETRLVCSLQSLPLTATTKGATPQKPKPRPMLVVADPESTTATSGDESAVDAGSDTSVRVPLSTNTSGSAAQIRSRLASRLGRPPPVIEHEPISVPLPKSKSHDSNTSIAALRLEEPRQKRIRESPYPVYWVEAFNAAYQKWVPVDPVVTKTVGKSSKLEPPASDMENSMVYVIAFEDDGSAKDVTRRYAKAYNAKTRRARVESTKGGERWWRRVTGIYKRAFELDYDQVEDAELAAKEAAEEMPRNVQDFKDHPYYALERHLRRNEVVFPRREVGKVVTGKSASSSGGKALEPIYRRRDVHIVKSADSWYRLGREIKAGEHPLKRVQPRKRPEKASEEEASDDEGSAGTAMYTAFQTISYQAPPVVNGRIPKNAYGNLDVYVPSMVPLGGVHIPHPETARAAKILKIDYSDAVTGFEFKGRHGTAVVKGAVVATDYKEAIEEIIRGFEDERAQAEETRRSMEAMRMWRRFLAGLRIRERIEGYDVEGERDIEEELNNEDEELNDDDTGGGFVPNEGEHTIEPTIRRNITRPFSKDDEEEAGGFSTGDLGGNEPQSGRYASDPVSSPHSKFSQEEEEETYGGGFLQSEEEVVKNEDDDDEEDEDAAEALFATELNSAQTIPNDPHFTYNLSASQRCSLLNNSTTDEAELNTAGGFLPEELEDKAYSNQNPLKPLPATIPIQAGDKSFSTLFQTSQATVKTDTIAPTSPKPSTNHEAPVIDSLSSRTPEPDITSPKDSQAALEFESRPRSRSREAVQSDHSVDEDDENKNENESEEEDEDKGSLLSHDPDDEDADPEWLL